MLSLQPSFGAAGLQMQSWPTPMLFIDNMSFPALAPNGSITAPSYSFALEPGLGMYRAGATDLRFAGSGQDLAQMTRITIGGLTNQSALGIGGSPGAPFHVLFSDTTAAATETYRIVNSATTDGNGFGITYRSTTTGVGAAANQQFGILTFRSNVHDHPTKSSSFSVTWFQSNTARDIICSNQAFQPSVTNILDVGSTSLRWRTVYVATSIIFTAGAGLQFNAAAGQRAGNSTLVAGTVTVANTNITANSIIYVNHKTPGGTMGFLSYTLNAGVGFTINSSNAADTSVVSYLIAEVS